MKKITLLFICLFFGSLAAESARAQNLSADFIYSDSSGCVPLSVDFQSTSTGSQTYLWSFGNGVTSTQENPSVVFVDSGVFSVTLIVGDGAGSFDTLEMAHAIQVVAKPEADFTYSSVGACVGNNQLDLQNQTNGATSFFWDFGDGETSNASNPSHTYQTPGTFSVTLIATNSYGCSDSYDAQQLMTVFPNPTPMLSVNTPSSCDSTTVFSFSDITQGSVLRTWRFGDGAESSQINPQHVYGSSGSFPITLIVTDQNGCTDSLPNGQTITIHEPQSLPISADAYAGCAPKTVSFSAPGYASNVAWDFGNGTGGSGTSSTCTYTSGGNYHVQLTALDSNGCQTQTQAQNLISISEGPTASFQASDWIVCPYTNVQFTNTSTGGSTYNWYQSGGQYSSNTHSTRTYHVPGNYTIMLVAQDSLGCSDTSTAVVQVTSPTADLGVGNASGCAPHTADFVDQSQGAAQWEWRFGDGTISQTQNPTHIYTVGGQYDVSLLVTDLEGCQDSIKYVGYVDVVGSSYSSGAPDTAYGCAPFSLDLSHNTIGQGSWNWDFGDGNTSSAQFPTHTYSDSGVYTVSLSTMTPQGCPLHIANYAVFALEAVHAGFAVGSVNCATMEASFIDTSDHAVAWHWDFGDGTTSSAQHPTHVFNSGGAHNVQLTVTSAHGCISTVLYSGVVDFSICGVSANGAGPGGGPGGGGGSTGPAITICAPAEIHFNNPFSNPLSCEWDLGDGTISSDQNPVHVYTQSGLYSIQVIAQFPSGPDTITWPNYLHVSQPVASFSASPLASCDSALMAFTGQSTPGCACSWNFGDGTFSSQASPEHAYPLQDDVYLVSLTAVDSLGCSAQAVVPITVSDDLQNFNISDSICLGELAHFVPADTHQFSFLWSFGDGQTSTNAAPVHQYSDPGSYAISVQMSNASGCTQTIQLDSIRVLGMMPDFTVLDSTEACLGTPLSFVPNNLSATNYRWRFGTVWVHNNPAPTYLFPAAGLYDVRLRYKVDGCTNEITYTDHIRIHDPQADFQLNQSTMCSPYEMQVVDNSTGATSYNWEVNGAQWSGPNPNLTTAQDSGNVALFVTDDFGCSDTAYQSFSLLTIAANFTYSNPVGCAPHVVNFTDASTQASTWHWDFGDGTTSNLPSPSHTYTTPGTYAISLIVSSGNGCTDTLVMNGLVSVTDVQADFTWNGGAQCAPAIAQFQDLSNNAATWLWDFGDGAGSNVQTPTHVYSDPGNYQVRLIVQNAQGCVDTSYAISPVEVTGPQANFTVQDTAACDSVVMNFVNLSQSATSWTWNFGDGTTSNDLNPTHVYNASGNYGVSLMVEDSMGCTSIHTVPNVVLITGQPSAGYSLQSSKGCGPFQVVILDSSINVTQVVWNMGDGTLLNQTPATYTYPQPGTYVISVHAQNSLGCQDSGLVDTVLVYDPVVPNINIQRVSVVSDHSVILEWMPVHNANVLGYDIYRRNLQTGQFEIVANIADPQLDQWVDAGLNTLENVYCYKVQPVLFCGVAQDLNTVRAHCTVNVSANTVGSDVHVNWTAYGGADPGAYKVYRQSDMSTGAELLAMVPSTELEYLDTATICTGYYTYRIEAVELDGTALTSWSDTSRIQLTTSPGLAAQVIRATVVDDAAVWVEWREAIAAHMVEGYRVMRSDDQETYEPIATVEPGVSLFEDQDVDVMYKPYYYRVDVLSTCPTEEGKRTKGSSVHLSLQEIDDFQGVLSWTAYEGWDTGVETYEIQRLNPDGVWETIQVVDGQTLEAPITH